MSCLSCAALLRLSFPHLSSWLLAVPQPSCRGDGWHWVRGWSSRQQVPLSKTPCAVDLYFIPCYCLHNYRHSACPSVSKSCGAAVFCGARCGSPAVPVLGVGLSSLCHSSYLEFVVPGVLRFDSITHSYCEVLLQFLRVIALIY